MTNKYISNKTQEYCTYSTVMYVSRSNIQKLRQTRIGEKSIKSHTTLKPQITVNLTFV